MHLYLYLTLCLLISPLETILASLELSQTKEFEHAKIRAFLIAGLCILMTSKTTTLPYKLHRKEWPRIGGV